MKVITTLRSETIFIHNNCCCRPFSRPAKYFSFHEFLHMIYGDKKTFISFYPTFFYSGNSFTYCNVPILRKYFTTQHYFGQNSSNSYDEHDVINNVGPRNKFSDKKHNERYYVRINIPTFVLELNYFKYVYMYIP